MNVQPYPILALIIFFFYFFFWVFFRSWFLNFFVCIAQLFGLLITFLCFFEIVLSKSVLLLYFSTWFYIDIFNIKFCIFLDSLTCTMLFIIFFISFCVQVFSIGYMSHDPFIIRFSSYLSLFTFFMLFLVTSDNFLQLFIGWEGVGSCSFLLISFWYTRILAVKAALKLW